MCSLKNVLTSDMVMQDNGQEKQKQKQKRPKNKTASQRVESEQWRRMDTVDSPEELNQGLGTC